MFRKEAYSLSDNVENHRTVLTLFYILYSSQSKPKKKLDDNLLDALEEGDISFQEFLYSAHNTHATKAQKEQLIELLNYNISDYNDADDCIDVYTSISSHPEKQSQKDITILRINQYPRHGNIIEDTFYITLLDKYDVSEDFYERNPRKPKV